MADDIVTALRRMATDFREEPRIYVSPMQAADEIERLRAWNVEITKLLKQAQVCMDIWQKSEDELIEFHQGKSIEALTKQADEIERLRTTIKELHHHLGEALYSDEWNTREYAIAAHSHYEKEFGNV